MDVAAEDVVETIGVGIGDDSVVMGVGLDAEVEDCGVGIFEVGCETDVWDDDLRLNEISSIQKVPRPFQIFA